MWSWLKERWETLAAAVGVKRFAIEGGIAAVLNVANVIASQTGEWPVTPSLAYVLAVATVFALLFFLDSQLRDRATQ